MHTVGLINTIRVNIRAQYVFMSWMSHPVVYVLDVLDLFPFLDVLYFPISDQSGIPGQYPVESC